MTPSYEDDPVTLELLEQLAEMRRRERPPASTATIVLVTLVLVVTLLNLALTVYVFLVARGLVQAGEQLQSFFSG